MRRGQKVLKIFEKPSRTKQAFRDECDINKIMQRFKKVAGVEYLEKFNGYVSGQFGDFSAVADYRSALDQVRRAEAVFMALPAIVRKRFENDAAKFLDFCHDPANIDEMVSMGLATKKVQETEPNESKNAEKSA